MRRTVIWCLILSLLLGFCGCGEAEQSISIIKSPESSRSEGETITVTETDGYLIPCQWKEDCIQDENYGYVTAAADLPEENFEICDGYFVSLRVDETNGSTTLLRYEMDGTELNRIIIPAAQGICESQNIGWYCFGTDSAWLIHHFYMSSDEETGERETYSRLQKWSSEGKCLVDVSIEELPIGDSFVSDLALDHNENPMLLVGNQVLCCDSQGKLEGTIQLPNTNYSFCRDTAGRMYLHDPIKNQVYPINRMDETLGSPLPSFGERSERVLSGGGSYDFFLLSDDQLRGVNLSTGIITDILIWADWNLSASVSSVGYFDENTLFISVYSLINWDSGTQLLTLSRIPAEQIPQKTVVRLAVGLGAENEAMGMTWADSLNTMVTEQINIFNRENSDYRVEIETYSSDEELNLKFLAMDAPDLIYWNSTAWLANTPSMALYGKKGYLTNLQPLFDTDKELNTDMFIPSLLDLMEGHTGGLYVLPLNYYYTALSVDHAYVGEQTAWNFSELLDIARTLPEDVLVLRETDRVGALTKFLKESIDSFVDNNAATCNFKNQDFYDLLTLCRDYFPPVLEGSESSQESKALLQEETAFGRMGQFATETLRSLDQQGRGLIGYPSAEGLGSIVLIDAVSICAMGQQQEGAWEFFRDLFTYDFQYNLAGGNCSIREDVFNDRENQYMERNDACTRAESNTARALILNAKNLRKNDSSVIPIVQEEAAAFFAGDKSAEDVAKIMESRVKIYLSEQS